MITDSGLMTAVSICMYATGHPIAGFVAFIMIFVAAMDFK